MITQIKEDYIKYRTSGPDFAKGIKVYLGGLDPSWSEEDIHRFMDKFGNILRVTIAKNEKQFSRGYGFVVFSSAAEAASSYGTVRYRNKLVEIKPSYKQNPAMYNSHGQRSQMEYPDNYSYNTQMTQDCSVGNTSRLAASPIAGLRKSSALSKHSKNFETIASLTSLKSRTIDDVSVNVIKLSNRLPATANYQAASELASINSPKHDQKPLEKAAHISRYSKEFHPNTFPASSTYPIEQASGISNSADFTSLYYQDDSPYARIASHLLQTDLGNNTAVRTRSAGSEKQHAVDSDVWIRFFTYPGRE